MLCIQVEESRKPPTPQTGQVLERTKVLERSLLIMKMEMLLCQVTQNSGSEASPGGAGTSHSPPPVVLSSRWVVLSTWLLNVLPTSFVD